MDELIANRAARPPALEEGDVPIKPLPTDLARPSLDPQQHGRPFSASLPDAHAGEYTEAPSVKTSWPGQEVKVISAAMIDALHAYLLVSPRFADSMKQIHFSSISLLTSRSVI
jgi:hypothetical protein